MRLPKLSVLQASREMVDTFKGYNHNLRIGDGEFFDMKNMTSDSYPVLSPRQKRGYHFFNLLNPKGLIEKDALCYVTPPYFVCNDYSVDMGLNNEPKQLVSMGAYVIIMPDKKWVNTMDLTEFGDIEAHFDNEDSQNDVTFSLCTIDGADYENVTVSPTAPEEPENMALWIDTSSEPHVLKKYSKASAVWVQVATTYVKISSPGIGTAFELYDGVTISGIKNEALKDLNASMVIWAKGDDYIVVVGILDAVTSQPAQAGVIHVDRKMPNMDFLVESENRLWGCRYGVAANGEVVNEIYSCKLGDFKNWNCFMGLSTDSYAATCGTDGQFTGAITHLGYPLFFKENYVHKVYGNYPANFQIQTTACRGVQRGCGRSLAIVNETLLYKSRSGVCAYDGSLPTEVSYALGNEAYSNAVGGAIGNKYYISMADFEGKYHLFVYDLAKGMWHKEDDLKVEEFCAARGELYAIVGSEIMAMLGSSTPLEDSLEWMVETGEIGISSPDTKYISRITIRMSMDIGSEVRFYAKYDFGDGWEEIGTVRSNNLRSFSIPIRPKRCDHMKLRIEGSGMAKIYSITKTIEGGSEMS